MSPKLFFVLTGVPGVGKTTIVKNVHQLLKKSDVECIGFYTEEVRENRSRVGFDVVTTENIRGRLARDLDTLRDPLPVNKVGKYGILIKEFEDVALPPLEKVTPSGQQLLLIDEIGKMEMFSAPFKTKIKQLFHPTSKHIILATIPCKKSDSLIEDIRTNGSTKLIVVTTTNRDQLPNIIAKEILLKINPSVTNI